ncbi:MAG: site-specific integrase [Ancalomicrobiaceae bacterium]|nr:site-specific integrase [Ancalomicrobiaceae bacterium]
MGTIIERRRKDGSIAYMAQIAMSREGKSFRENKTFDRRPAATAWIKTRERELANLDLAQIVPARREPTLKDAIDRYIKESVHEHGKTKIQVLNAIRSMDIAERQCSAVTSQALVEFAQELLDGGRAPQTVLNYLSHLSACMAIARPAWGYSLDQRAMADAIAVAKRLGLVTRSRMRNRRPTLDELDRLMQFFGERQTKHPASMPMQAIIAFALFSTRRADEITRITWADYDKDGKRVLVRDMKHPGEKVGNHIWCDLPEQAIAIIDRMPRVADEIFPYNSKTFSSIFPRACHMLAIDDLHFHDLRHEGISRLFEMGLTIPYVASVSGHRSWTNLKRYTHLRQTGDKYAGWRWLHPVRNHQPGSIDCPCPIQ